MSMTPTCCTTIGERNSFGIARMSKNMTNSPDNNKRKNQVTNVIFIKLHLVTSIAIHVSNIWKK